MNNDAMPTFHVSGEAPARGVRHQRAVQIADDPFKLQTGLVARLVDGETTREAARSE